MTLLLHPLYTPGSVSPSITSTRRLFSPQPNSTSLISSLILPPLMAPFNGCWYLSPGELPIILLSSPSTCLHLCPPRPLPLMSPVHPCSSTPCTVVKALPNGILLNPWSSVSTVPKLDSGSGPPRDVIKERIFRGPPGHSGSESLWGSRNLGG